MQTSIVSFRPPEPGGIDVGVGVEEQREPRGELVEWLHLRAHLRHGSPELLHRTTLQRVDVHLRGEVLQERLKPASLRRVDGRAVDPGVDLHPGIGLVRVEAQQLLRDPQAEGQSLDGAGERIGLLERELRPEQPERSAGVDRLHHQDERVAGAGVLSEDEVAVPREPAVRGPIRPEVSVVVHRDPKPERSAYRHAEHLLRQHDRAPEPAGIRSDRLPDRQALPA